MAGGGEGEGVDDLVHEALKFDLEGRVEMDVVDGSARFAHDVVMMSRGPLGEFVARDATGTVVRSEHLGLFQHREGSVQRGQREIQLVEEFLGASWPVGCGEGADHRSASARVADAERGKPLGDLLIECLHVPPTV